MDVFSKWLALIAQYITYCMGLLLKLNVGVVSSGPSGQARQGLLHT